VLTDFKTHHHAKPYPLAVRIKNNQNQKREKMAIKMAKENLSDLTTEELIKMKKTTTMVTGVLAGMLTVLLIMATLLTIKQGTMGISLIAVALGLSPILFINFNSIKTINAELKSRNPN
jgi:hypothetical protein